MNNTTQCDCNNPITTVPTKLFHAASLISKQASDHDLPIDHVPGPTDILLGRGKRNWSHPANKIFRQIVRTHAEHYKNASKPERTKIVSKILDEARDNGWNFLQKNDGHWTSIGDTKARMKIGHALRDHLITVSRKRKRSKTPSKTSISANAADNNDDSAGKRPPSYAISSTDCNEDDNIGRFQLFDTDRSSTFPALPTKFHARRVSSESTKSDTSTPSSKKHQFHDALEDVLDVSDALLLSEEKVVESMPSPVVWSQASDEKLLDRLLSDKEMNEMFEQYADFFGLSD